MRSSLSSKKLRYWYATSTSGLPPFFWWSSCVAPPPLNACDLIFLAIFFGSSVMKIAEFSFDADILVLAPCKAGRNLEWRRAGFL